MFKILGLTDIFFGILTWPKFSLTSYQIVSSLKRQGVVPNTIIDIGGNLGQFTIASNKLLNEPNIFTFEPMPQCANKIKKYVSNLKNIQVFQMAIGEISKNVFFRVNSHIQSSSILPLAPSHLRSFPTAQEAELIEVEVKTLDSILGNVDFNAPVLLKIDTQGYEANVIRGSEEVLKKVDYILIEVSFKEMYSGELLFPEILELMRNYDFRFIRPIGWLSDPKTQEILQMDALFCRESSSYLTETSMLDA